MTDMEKRVQLGGSHRDRLDTKDYKVLGPPDKDVITATIVLNDGHTASELEHFAEVYDLVIDNDPDTLDRTVTISGHPSDMQEAFATDLALVKHSELGVFRKREGSVSVPEYVAPAIFSVLGLDDRPTPAKPHLRAQPRAGTEASYYPNELADLYGFPKSDGHGVNVAVVELGGAVSTKDSAYWKEVGVTTPSITTQTVDGAKPKSDGVNGADGEVALDYQVIGAIAPAAKQAVVFGPNTDAGFLDAFSAAIKGNDITSCSWGGPEESWTPAALASFSKIFQDAYNQGKVVLAAAGDSGSNDSYGGTKSHVDFPASSPYVIACGGTLITGTNPLSEVVWNENSKTSATGGGVSNTFTQAGWQQPVASSIPQADSGHTGYRVVPDVAGNADPDSGYNVMVDGKDMVIGGTSAVAPLWAGLLARVKSLGYTIDNPLGKLYAGGQLRDIVSGNNGKYKATTGYDACTGLGTPDGAKVLSAFSGVPSTPVDPPVDPTPPVNPPLPPDGTLTVQEVKDALSALTDTMLKTVDQAAVDFRKQLGI